MPTSNHEPQIRRAESKDAEALARIGRASFAETFGWLYPAPDLEAYLAETHNPLRAAALLADPACAAWLVEAGGETVGYAVAGPCGLPHPEVSPDCGELQQIYLLRSWQGRGLGQRLLQAALSWLERDGPRMLWIGVWSQNCGAQRLYSRTGFEMAGEYDFPVGRSLDREFIYRRRPQLWGEPHDPR